VKSRRREEEVLRKRIMAARKASGFSITEATKRLGFENYQTLSTIEKGTREIKAHKLSNMARLYGRSLDYFFEPDVLPDSTPLWRKPAEKGVKQVQRQFLSFLENYTNLVTALKVRKPGPNSMLIPLRQACCYLSLTSSKYSKK